MHVEAKRFEVVKNYTERRHVGLRTAYCKGRRGIVLNSWSDVSPHSTYQSGNSYDRMCLVSVPRALWDIRWSHRHQRCHWTCIRFWYAVVNIHVPHTDHSIDVAYQQAGNHMLWLRKVPVPRNRSHHPHWKWPMSHIQYAIDKMSPTNKYNTFERLCEPRTKGLAFK